MTAGIASVDALYEAFGDLRRALDTQDPSLIQNATRAVSAAAADVRAQGAWRMDSQLRMKLESLAPLIESARVRVNLASDDVRRRVALLADRGAQSAPLTYGR